MSTARKVAGIFFVHESLVDDEGFWPYEFEDLKRQALWNMSELGRVDKDTLQVETHRPVELDGVRLPFVTEDGREIPNDYVVVRFSAMAVPHEGVA